MSNMNFKYGTIRLDSANAVYYSGQVISGSVVFELDQPLTFSAINIELHGEANVNWTEKESEEYNGVKTYHEVEYVGHEEYCRMLQCLSGGTGTSQLRTGPQVLPFIFQIPNTAPSTFEGERGEISYRITAYLVFREPMMETEELMKKITVVAPFDLNMGNAEVKEPINLEFEEVYGCDCICSPDPVTVRIQLPVSGYCPGQVIPVSVEVHNESSVEVRKILFQLISRERYRSQRPIAEYVPPEKVLATLKKGPVMSKTQRNFTCDLIVPDMISPYLENCSIIDVGYFFKTIIKLSGCNDDLDDESEICLGLVPLVGFTDGGYTHPMAHSLPLGPVPAPATLPEAVPASSVEPSNTPYGANEFRPVNTVSYPAESSPYSNPNPVQSAPYPVASPPSYDSCNINNTPYPTYAKEGISVSSQQPFSDYEIGFKVSDGGLPPYPGNNMPSGSVPPYPSDNRMPQCAPAHVGPGYPPKGLSINLPSSFPPQSGPSAPPPSS